MSGPDSLSALNELAAWPSDTVGLGLLGYPVSHSLSPAMHNAALSVLAKDDRRYEHWRYQKFSVGPADLARALTLLHTKGFIGVNITVPHKEAVLQHVEAADDFTRAASAGNTLMRTPTGWRASNTDGGGLADALQTDLQVTLPGCDVILLGAGGAARAAAAQCLAHGVRSLWIFNRSRERLDPLIAQLSARAHGVPLRGCARGEIPTDLPTGALVINATSLGLKPEDPAPLDLRRVPRPAHVYDMIYNPPVTALLRQATELGIANANGLSMLVHQGARSLALWTGRAVPVATMAQIARASLAAKSP